MLFRHFRRGAGRAALPMLAVMLAIVATASTALAHGHTTVGDYQLVIGFHNEPAYQGEPNGLDLFVTNSKTNEQMNGLESTLKAEIIYGSAAKMLTIKPQFGKDGAYTAYVLPTEAGNYTWHIFGSIRDTPIDVKMASSPQTFSAVEPKSQVAFPSAAPSAADVQSQIDAAARLGAIGLIVGILGLLAGAGGLYVGLRGSRAVTGTRAGAHEESTPARSGV